MPRKSHHFRGAGTGLTKPGDEQLPSGISSDPDSLYQILDPGLFSFALTDDNQVLQATLEQSLPQTQAFAAPEPAPLLTFGVGMIALCWSRSRRKAA